MIPIFDLTRQNNFLKNRYAKILQDSLSSGIFILGPSVSEFERTFASYIGVKYAVAVASGTDALTLSLLALGIGKGDEVILPANSYPSSFGVSITGARIVLVDIDPGTYTIDSHKLDRAVTKKTKAIIPVHMYGQMADMHAIMLISKKYSIPVIEDVAQAVGAELKMKIWKKAGSIGVMGCFSFYPTKNLGAFGDGGIIVTNNKSLYKKLKLLRMYGEKRRYQSVLVGKNSRLDELQAAFLLEKLKYLKQWTMRRREISLKYRSKINNPHIILPNLGTDIRHVFHLFVIRCKSRDILKSYLEKRGIQTAIHYPVPIHLVESFKFLGYKKGSFPEAEQASKEILSLPIYPELRDNEVEVIIDSLNHFLHDTTS